MRSLFNILLILFTYLTVSFSEDTVKSKEIYLDYISYPKRVFTGQKFDITLKATILKSEDQYDKIVLNFVDGENIDIITKEAEFSKEKDNIFFTKLSFKTQDKKFILPDVTVAILKDGEVLDF